ncbi:uncharacterized protein LOC114255923 [Camellia sinensis]|uniref:uncharacterized protein LOC114255923 n=1 Tax=Camellia sinensis TaxID=4442 RepID=UPI001035BA49|nr:uncharacterized protein LOC114255923 [Camellia sinensis]
MQHFVYVVIFSNPMLEIKLVVILLLVRVFQIGRKKKKFKLMLEVPIVLIIKLQGNFLELFKFLADHNEDVKMVTLSNAPQNLKLTSPDIRKDIVNVTTFEIINVIIRDLGDALFSILIDEARDISIKEQMPWQRIIIKLFYFSLWFLMWEKQAAKVAEALNTRELSSGQGLNQETNLKRAGDTRWGSHYGTLHKIDVPQMVDMFVARGRKRRNAQEITNLHHYRTELFYTVLDMQIQELNAHFTESNTELLLCVACLNPSNSFSSFDRKKLIHLAQFYPKEFSSVELMVLNDQLDTYIIDMLSSSKFSMLNGIADLAKKMVETRRDKVYPLVYLFLTLALILPIATATIERVFQL